LAKTHQESAAPEMFCLFVCLFVPCLSSCYEKATMALYFEQIPHRLIGVVHFRGFQLL